MKEKNKPSWREIISIALGDGGCNLVWTTIGSYLTLYYTDSVGLAAATIGTLMLLTRLLDGISDLIMGSIIDRTHTRWGEARPWILWTAIPMGLGLVLMFSVPGSLTSGGKLTYACISYVIMAVVVYTACNLAYNTLLSLEAPNPKDRVTMSSIRFFVTMSVVLFINYICNNFVAKFGWTGMAAIFGTIGAVLLLITILGTKERTNIEKNSAKVEEKDNTAWLKEIDGFKDTGHKIDEKAFHPKNILEAFNKKLGSENTTVVTDVGQHQMWTAQYWSFEKGRSFLTTGGLGTMGFGLGGAIGTKLGTPQKNVLLVTGDGSFKMNCNELATVATQDLPIVILLFNNNALGMVRQWQNLFSDKRYSETDIYDKTDYIMLANAYGIEGHKAQNLEELNEILGSLILDIPGFVECKIDHDINVFPIVPPNDNLLNLICN